MRNLILPLAFSLALIACNSESDSTEVRSDTASHQAEHSTTDGQGHMQSMHNAMENMMQQMHSSQPTGDADYDFAMMMKHHHQSAIDMARIETDGGTDEQMKQIAQKILLEQQQENAQFDQFMQGKQPKGNSDFGQRAMGMMTPISNMPMENSSLDALFASMMITHHEDGVKMAQEYLKVGKSEDLKKIANSITETQPKEVQVMRSWLNDRKG